VFDEQAVRDAFAQAPAHPKRELEIDPAALGERVAVWQAGLYGLDWIRRLAEGDGGIALLRGGYPEWFLVRARDVATQFREGIPDEHSTWSTGLYDFPLGPNWLGKTTIDWTAVMLWGSVGWYLVKAWDES
jgi:hypothetical protein